MRYWGLVVAAVLCIGLVGAYEPIVGHLLASQTGGSVIVLYPHPTYPCYPSYYGCPSYGYPSYPSYSYHYPSYPSYNYYPSFQYPDSSYQWFVNRIQSTVHAVGPERMCVPTPSQQYALMRMYPSTTVVVTVDNIQYMILVSQGVTRSRNELESYIGTLGPFNCYYPKSQDESLFLLA